MNKPKTICDAAQAAWRDAPASARQVCFRWKGRTYVSTMTMFRMLVNTAAGQPAACRWF